MQRRSSRLLALAFGALVACSQPSALAPVRVQPQGGAAPFSLAAPRKGGGYSVLYNFTIGIDGQLPLSSLIAVNGELYGTTRFGGEYGQGVVFKINPANGKEGVLHSFGDGNDGSEPYGNLYAVGTELYGLTNAGGANHSGAIFKISTSGREKVIYSFGNSGTTDGQQPLAGLVALNGNLFGTASIGGKHGEGAVFETSTTGKELVIYSFDFVDSSRDASLPESNLIAVGKELYGTGFFGGNENAGAVFKIDSSGSEQLVYSFKSSYAGDGGLPTAGVVDIGNVLYGTTSHGGASGGCVAPGSNACGTVFSLTTGGRERVLHSFGVKTGDGQVPNAALIDVNGVLYGTTEQGGAIGEGTIFDVTTGGKENVVHSFRGETTDGSAPEAALVDVNGTLYGTASRGGKFGAGIVYELKP